MALAIAINHHQFGGDTVPAVSARELHATLEIGRDFTSWAKYQIERTGFSEGADYLLTKIGEQLPSGLKHKIDWIFSVEMAKHIAMMSGTERGREVRRYFIDCERRAQERRPAFDIQYMLANPHAVLDTIAAYSRQNQEQQETIALLQPKADFHDAVTEAVNCQTIQEAAKVLGTGPGRLFVFLRDKKILRKDNLPLQQHLEAGRFRVVERSYTDQLGEKHVYTRTLITGKGLTYLQGMLGRSA